MLDELTNHLDIENREARGDALNTYEGCIILVGHGVYFVKIIADRLWLVENGRVSILTAV